MQLLQSVGCCNCCRVLVAAACWLLPTAAECWLLQLLQSVGCCSVLVSATVVECWLTQLLHRLLLHGAATLYYVWRATFEWCPVFTVMLWRCLHQFKEVGWCFLTHFTRTFFLFIKSKGDAYGHQFRTFSKIIFFKLDDKKCNTLASDHIKYWRDIILWSWANSNLRF